MASFRIMSSTCPRSGQRDAAGDHADVAEGLREVAGELAGRRVDLLRQQAERARPCTERGVEVLGLVEAPLTNQIIHEPEAAQQEGALVAKYAVGRVVVAVPVEEAATRAEAVDDGPCRGHHAGVVGGHNVAQRQRQQAGVHPSTAEVLAQRLGVLIPRLLEDGRVDGRGRRAPLGNGSGEADPLGDGGGTVEGDLAQGRRVGEHAPFAPYLPDALVRLSPSALGGLSRSGQTAPQGGVELAAATDPLVCAVEYLAVNIVLTLFSRTIAPSHRCRIPVPGKLSVLVFHGTRTT